MVIRDSVLEVLSVVISYFPFCKYCYSGDQRFRFGSTTGCGDQLPTFSVLEVLLVVSRYLFHFGSTLCGDRSSFTFWKYSKL